MEAYFCPNKLTNFALHHFAEQKRKGECTYSFFSSPNLHVDGGSGGNPSADENYIISAGWLVC